jgi:hypothetical protein
VTARDHRTSNNGWLAPIQGFVTTLRTCPEDMGARRKFGDLHIPENPNGRLYLENCPGGLHGPTVCLRWSPLKVDLLVHVDVNSRCMVGLS